MNRSRLNNNRNHIKTKTYKTNHNENKDKNNKNYIYDVKHHIINDKHKYKQRQTKNITYIYKQQNSISKNDKNLKRKNTR